MGTELLKELHLLHGLEADFVAEPGRVPSRDPECMLASRHALARENSESAKQEGDSVDQLFRVRTHANRSARDGNVPIAFEIRAQQSGRARIVGAVGKLGHPLLRRPNPAHRLEERREDGRPNMKIMARRETPAVVVFAVVEAQPPRGVTSSFEEPSFRVGDIDVISGRPSL